MPEGEQNIERELYLQTIGQIANNLYREWVRNHILRKIDTKTAIACSDVMDDIMMKHSGEEKYKQQLLQARQDIVEEMNGMLDDMMENHWLAPDFAPKTEMQRSTWISDAIKEFHKILTKKHN